MKINKFIMTAASLVMAVPLLASCSLTHKQEKPKVTQLNIVTDMYSDEQSLRNQYTELYEFSHPNVKVHITSMQNNNMYGMYMNNGKKKETPYDKLKKTMQGDNPPDFVIFNYNDLSDLTSNNLLMPLGSLITKDNFDTSGIAPVVLNGMKSAAGDNKLYALSPEFNSYALLYNKKIFQNQGVTFPDSKGMSWQQLFQLARRVSSGDGDKRIYGFDFDYYYGGFQYYSLQRDYLSQLPLKIFNSDKSKMTVDSKAWQSAWSPIVDLVNQKIIPFNVQPPRRQPSKNGKYNPFQNNMFLMGHLAMTIVNNGQLNNIIQANQQAKNIDGFDGVDWGIAPVPYQAVSPNVGGPVNFMGVMGINAKAQNVDDAWNLMKFVNSDKWAQLKSHSTYEMVSRTKYIKPLPGAKHNYDVSAFYSEAPASGDLNPNVFYQKYPQLGSIMGMGQSKFNQVLQGNVSIADALKQWQTQGDSMLQHIKNSGSAGGGMMSSGSSGGSTTVVVK